MQKIVAVAVLMMVVISVLAVATGAGLAASIGIRPGVMHYSLMAALSVVVVSAFQAVGAILVVAFPLRRIPGP